MLRHINYMMQRRAAVIRKFLIRCCHDVKRNHAEIFLDALHDDNRQICINYQSTADQSVVNFEDHHAITNNVSKIPSPGLAPPATGSD